MTDFLTNLSSIFIERFLKTHFNYLENISYIIRKMYGEPESTTLEDNSKVMVNQILEQNPKMLRKKRQDPTTEVSEFRNLRNCWYNECALNYPFDSLDERIKFASWKIVQCFYTVFAAIASLVCCYHEEQHAISKTLNLYANEFLLQSEKKAFVLPPLNLYLNQQGKIPEETKNLITWEWGRKYCVPKIEKCLIDSQNKNGLTAIPHYLRALREWATYQDAYLLFRLYGESPKNKLDEALKKIAFAYCLQTELYLINLYGWDAFNQQFRVFSNELKYNLKLKSPTLIARYKTYKNMELEF